MSLRQLLKVVAPTARPLETESRGRLAQIRKRLGLSLPRDYVELARTYGSGGFRDNGGMYIELFNPLSSRYFEELQEMCGVLDMLKLIGEDEVPYGVVPERPGLLPWGSDVNGGKLFWLTEGKAACWHILAKAARSNRYEQFDMSITSFLAGCFTRQVICHLWSDPVFFSGVSPVKFVRASKSRVS